MADGVRRTLRDLEGVQLNLLGDTPPFRVEQDERRKGVGIGNL